jgi:hypothetical protein
MSKTSQLSTHKKPLIINKNIIKFLMNSERTKEYLEEEEHRRAAADYSSSYLLLVPLDL